MPRTWIDPLVRTKQWKRGMRFCTWNVRSLYRAGSLTAVARKLARRKLDLVGVQEVRRGKRGTVRGGNYNFFKEKETKVKNWKKDFFCTTQNSFSS